MATGDKKEFKVEEVENGFIITNGERRFVSSREPAELLKGLKGLASILGVDAGAAKGTKKKKERGPNTKLPAGAAV